MVINLKAYELFSREINIVNPETIKVENDQFARKRQNCQRLTAHKTKKNHKHAYCPGCGNR